MVKETAETTIRIYKSSKEELKKLKYGNEGDAVVLARLLAENKELKKEKDKLYNLLSVVIVPNVRVKTFTEIIEKIINGSTQNKLQVLKDFFNSELLTSEHMEVKEAVEIVKNSYDKNKVPKVLTEFEVYIDDIH